MTQDDYKPDRTARALGNDELDAALAKYAAVEPRAGLQERILAGLKAERERVTRAAWWRWPALAGLVALVVIVSLALLRKPRSATPDNLVRRPTQTLPSVRQYATAAASHAAKGAVLHTSAAVRRRWRGVSADSVVSAGREPRLDQFPSPRPLSEQEQILARYVGNYPRHAALMARARTEALQRDRDEETGTAAASNGRDLPQ